jgi:cell division protein ZapA (FtsZ GTPase activity inhibitor)
MSSDATIVVNLPILGEQYKLRCTPDKEEAIRKYAVLLNQFHERMKSSFPNLKEKDYIAMAIISLLGEIVEQQEIGSDLEIKEKLTHLLDVIG